MKISGKTIKARRKSLGLSQSELADEICTQATISLIEKKDKVPSMAILISICDRLEINVDTVIREDEDLASTIFKKAEKCVFNKDAQGIQDLIAKIDEKKLTNSQQIKQLYFYQAYVELKLHKNYDKAIFIYTRAYNVDTHMNDFLDSLINLYISQAYIGKNATEEAEIYAEQTREIIESKSFQSNDNSKNKLLIFSSIAEVYEDLKQRDQAVAYLKMGINESKTSKNYFLLDYFYLELAKLEDDEFGLLAAYVIGDIIDNQNTVQEALKLAKKKKINLPKSKF
ncbi:helix-turn-helix domain-containing protein [Lactobacillus sp. YT155]|uniref:helix-turn-helix domain-containing protein n=1 Tax=Lactobacillus sp. YT155 TaxID=3060955 RepID=UPI00265DAE2E|nr:helix-turn-helix domain-containing protein [Lactobacillus sp. YT155]MDO1604983.1 helix-turn-helix domain-containing protein [Lactobacillus sp. YT155]